MYGSLSVLDDACLSKALVQHLMSSWHDMLGVLELIISSVIVSTCLGECNENILSMALIE